MRQHFRIYLPPLKSVDALCTVRLVQVNQTQSVVRADQIRLETLPDIVRSAHVYVLLDPVDAVLAEISLPPLPRARRREAVVASVEPMILGRIDTTLIAYATRDEHTGTTQVAWTDKDELLRVWRLMLGLGLKVKGIMPGQPLSHEDGSVFEAEALMAGKDDAQALPALPECSFTQAHEEPISRSGLTRATIIWICVAACIWIFGLNLYAMRLTHETETLGLAIESTVRESFPELPVLLNPVIQAQRQLDLLERQAQGATQDPFVELTTGTGALLPFVSSKVRTLEYENGHLILTLASDANTMMDSLSLADLIKEATRKGLTLTHDMSSPNRWQVSVQTTSTQESAPDRIRRP